MKGKKIIIILLVILAFILLVIFGGLKIAKTLYPMKYSEDIAKYSKKYNVDPYLVAAVIKAESNFKPKAKSKQNAYGLMQITPNTAEWASKEMKLENFMTEDLYNPEVNINMGCWYLSNLKKEFNDIDLVLAAYNGGRGNVQKWLSNPKHSPDGKTLQYIPFKETDQYVKKVKVNYNIYKFLYDDKK